MSKRFIVTGGAGFIGSNLVKGLNERGYNDIIVVDHLTDDLKRQNLKSLTYSEYFDKTEFRSLFKAGKVPTVDCVFHLGACSSTLVMDESYLHENNYLYTRELCEWSLQNRIRFIYASSAATYGDGSLGYSDEDALTPKVQPLNPYGKSKQMFDLWVLENDLFNTIVGLKYFNVFGPHEDHKAEMRSLVNKAYTQVMQDDEITLFKSHRPDYRDGEQTRDFIYVDDAVKVTLFFYDHPEISGLFNCGTGTARNWIDLAKALFTAMNREPKIRFIDIPQEIRDKYQYHTQADLNKLRRAGYSEPFLPIEEGVYRYVKKYLDKRPTSV